MKTDYEYIHFVKIEDKPKTSVWSCRNTHHGEELGQILWFAKWRQYCYVPSTQAWYSIGCLRDIASFIEELERDRKEKVVASQNAGFCLTPERI